MNGVSKIQLPVLNDLPEPPSGKTGWPWTETREGVRAARQDDLPGVRITVITPSFNQARFLEETMRSVLLQGYSNLEYIVIDGGSTDESIEIIRKYDQWIPYRTREPDRGQAEAINKGFRMMKGDLTGWINSDDILLPKALFKLAAAHVGAPNSILLGDVINFSDATGETRYIAQRNVSFHSIVAPQISNMTWHQPGVYVPRELIYEVGLLDESLRYLFDQDWLCRLLQVAPVEYLEEAIAKFRVHSASKTTGEKYSWLPEHEVVAKRYWDKVPALNKKHVIAYHELVRAAIHLGATHWERMVGWKHLGRAASIYPPIIFSILFLELGLRSILPYRLLVWIRNLMRRELL